MAVARIEQFTAALTGLQSQDDIVALCTLELDYLRSALELTSFKRTVTDYRNVLKDLGETKALELFKLTPEEYATIKAESRQQVYSDNTNLRPISDIDEILIKGEDLVDSNSYTAIAVGLCLLTGRRLTEVLLTAVMTPINDDVVLFSGQLKTKGSENAQIEPYEIPVLTGSNLVCDALNRLRQLKNFSELTPKQVHSRCNKSCNEQVHRHFLPLIPKCCVKDLRAVYSTLCYEQFCSPNISETAYCAKILGHSELDLTTAQSYKDFYIQTT